MRLRRKIRLKRRKEKAFREKISANLLIIYMLPKDAYRLDNIFAKAFEVLRKQLIYDHVPF